MRRAATHFKVEVTGTDGERVWLREWDGECVFTASQESKATVFDERLARWMYQELCRTHEPELVAVRWN